MRNILITGNGFFALLSITIIFVFTASLFSQDFEPAQARFNYMGNDTLIDVNIN